MFDIGWTEMLVIAVVMIVVVGPKDLPKMLRTFGKMTSKVRGMAGDFQKQFNEALKEAELDEVKKSVDSLRGMNPTSEIKKAINPFEKAAADVRAGLQTAMAPKPSTASVPASPAVHEAEPLKAGATAVPGEAAPSLNGTASLDTPPPQLATAVSSAPSPAPPADPIAVSGPANAAAPSSTAPKPAGRPRKTAAATDGKPAAAARASSAKPAGAARTRTSRSKTSGTTK